jgi:hypothetical protein
MLRTLTIFIARHMKLSLLVIPLMLGPMLLAQTTKVVKGSVSSAQGPLAGVSVTVDRTTTGTATDAQGNFSISAPENASLIFSYTGFKEQRVSVRNQSVING